MPATTQAAGSNSADSRTSTCTAGDTGTTLAGRRAGYVIAALIDVVLLWVTHQLLDWGWPSFLTPEFDEVLPIISASFVVGIAFSVVLLIHDPPWLKLLDDIVGAVIAFIASWRTLTVFPFDFSDWGTDWAWLLRAILVVALVGTAIAVVVGTVRLVMLLPPDHPGGARSTH
jgi:hypothetical protein